MKKLGLIIVLSALLAACGAPTLDATSEESRKSSIERMKQALPDGERGRFERAVMIVAMDGLSIADSGGSVDAALVTLDGKTAEEIMSEADSIVAAREAREREQALQEIAELEQAVADLEGVRVERMDGLLVDLCREHGADVVVKGLRGGADFDCQLGTLAAVG